MMFPKPEKKQKERRGLQQGKKPKKETAPWRQNILAHHQDRPSGADRGEFPAKIVKELIAEADGVCQSCRTAPDTTTHHVYPRGRRGRGVKTNGLRLCGTCHDRIQTHEDELQHWIEVYRQRFGERFWFDETDWEEYNRKQAESQAEEEAQRQRREQLEPIINLLNESLGRRLRAREQRFIDGLNEQQRAMFAGLLRDMMGTYVPDPTFGYGHFND
jgi:transcription elongation factor Elf1